MERGRKILRRRLARYNHNFAKYQSSWTEVIYEASMNTLHRIVLSVETFFSLYRVDKDKQLAPLHIAAALGDFYLCKYILGKTTNKNPKGSKNLIGVRNSRFVVISQNIASFGLCRATPLHLAALNGYTEICKLIMAIIENKNPSTDWKLTALHIAATNGYLDTYKSILKNVDDKNPKDENGGTPLHIAAKNGYIEMCRLAIRHLHVAERNPKDQNCNTPLHLAARYGHWQLCKLFLNKIIKKNPGNKVGDTPLHMAAGTVSFGNSDHLRTCKIFMKSIVLKNPRNFFGQTPLHMAVQSGNLAICKLIIQYIEEKNPQDLNGDTPLHNAAHLGYFKIARLIINNMEDKKDLNLKNNHGLTAEHLALRGGHFQKLRTLKLSLFL